MRAVRATTASSNTSVGSRAGFERLRINAAGYGGPALANHGERHPWPGNCAPAKSEEPRKAPRESSPCRAVISYCGEKGAYSTGLAAAGGERVTLLGADGGRRRGIRTQSAHLRDSE